MWLYRCLLLKNPTPTIGTSGLTRQNSTDPLALFSNSQHTESRHTRTGPRTLLHDVQAQNHPTALIRPKHYEGPSFPSCSPPSAVLYTCLPWLLSKCNINIENCSFCMFYTALFHHKVVAKFFIHFPGGQLTPFAPMCGRPCLLPKNGLGSAVSCLVG